MEYQGKGVSKGAVLGRIHYVRQASSQVEARRIERPEDEIARFETARNQAAFQLGQLAVSTAEKLGEENALLFHIHQMMLEDLDYRESVEEKIKREHVCAEFAVNETANEFSHDFAELEDEYMQARAVDVLDVSRRVVEILIGARQDQTTFDEPVILASQDFAPSETAQMEKTKTLAILTAGGASNSHTAIFARTMGIPAVIGLGTVLDESWDGRECIVDGEIGTVIVDPSPAQISEIREKIQLQQQCAEELQSYIGKNTAAVSGHRVKLYANIGSVKDAKFALQNDAEGIGLFRSEFLYLERHDNPDEETQFNAYREVAEQMGGRPVIIRTLDIGADKQVTYLDLPAEKNPALGLRALRICLTQPNMFKTQLRAIYRASVYGDLSIMLPMVTSVWEVRRTKELAAEVRAELAEQHIPFCPSVPIGIMIETPAAALISDALAKETAFFSIGTNDLTQYTLAVDRQNDRLDTFFDAHHEAVLRLIEMTVHNAHAQGIWVGICGELAADPQLTKRFLDMGIDELSVTPFAILPLRKHICQM
ncbi:MAG: phosphoenolpyruvate--protein phosphotransferase [Lawsonibacter sp.]